MDENERLKLLQAQYPEATLADLIRMQQAEAAYPYPQQQQTMEQPRQPTLGDLVKGLMRRQRSQIYQPTATLGQRG